MARDRVHKKGEKNFSQIFESFKDRLSDEIGAIGSFVGLVRGRGKKGGKLEKLHYETAESADQELEEIARKVEKEFSGVSEVAIHHIVDDLSPGEEIVYVLAAGRHREEVFEALPEIMERVKTEVRIWKKEVTESEEYWMHEVED